MPSERVQRRIDRLLDEAEHALDEHEWPLARERCQDVLRLDATNGDALEFLAVAEREITPPSSPTLLPRGEKRNLVPTSFAGGRYQVKKFLGEGGKKKVYLAHDTLLDRDVAFALIKTEGLDQTARERISREAQAMGRLGAHPHIVTVFDLGTEPPLAGTSFPLPLGEKKGEGKEGIPYMVTELMDGGDVEGLIARAPEHKLPLEQALAVAEQVCDGLEFAHSKGIVHRDLKPGNVWLTAAAGSRQPAIPSPWRERVRVRATPQLQVTLEGWPAPSPRSATLAWPLRSIAPD